MSSSRAKRSMLSVLIQVATVSDYNTFMRHTSAYSRGKGKGDPRTGHEGPKGEYIALLYL